MPSALKIPARPNHSISTVNKPYEDPKKLYATATECQKKKKLWWENHWATRHMYHASCKLYLLSMTTFQVFLENGKDKAINFKSLCWIRTWSLPFSSNLICLLLSNWATYYREKSLNRCELSHRRFVLSSSTTA